MSKHCRHERVVEGCNHCWLYAHDERYQRLWDGLPQIENPRLPTPVERSQRPGVRGNTPAIVPAPIKAKPLCTLLGEEVRRDDCPTCAGKVQLKVFACPVHGTCTVSKRLPDVPGCCATCLEHRTQAEVK